MSPRHALAGLIDHVRDQNGWSDSDIVRRALRAGHRLSKSNLSRVRNTEVVALTASTIQALAAGLEIPESAVARAALLSMGIGLQEPDSADPETAISADISLSTRDRAILLGVLRMMREQPERPAP